MFVFVCAVFVAWVFCVVAMGITSDALTVGTPPKHIDAAIKTAIILSFLNLIPPVSVTINPATN